MAIPPNMRRVRHRLLGGMPQTHYPRLAPSTLHLALSAPDLNQNQGDPGHKATTEKLTEKPEKKKGDGEKEDDTGAPPEHLRLDTGAPPECPLAQTEKSTHQGPPPLTDVAKKLINNDIRGSTEKTFKSRVNTLSDYCTKQGADTKSCHPNMESII